MLGRTTARLTATVAMAAGFGLVAATTAGAHECFNTSRSAQGNAMAGSRSQAWFTLVVADAIAEGVTSGDYTAEQADCILEAYTANGGPSSFTIQIKVASPHGAVGTDRNGRSSDGRGIDHVFDAYGGVIFGAFAECGVAF